MQTLAASDNMRLCSDDKLVHLLLIQTFTASNSLRLLSTDCFDLCFYLFQDELPLFFHEELLDALSFSFQQ
jgi:hypothetical protein